MTNSSTEINHSILLNQTDILNQTIDHYTAPKVTTTLIPTEMTESETPKGRYLLILNLSDHQSDRTYYLLL